MSLRKGGADTDALRALRYLLASEKELQEAEEQAQSLGQWLADFLGYRQQPNALTPFLYRTMSDATEQAVHEVCSTQHLDKSQCVSFVIDCAHAYVMMHRWRLGICKHQSESLQVVSREIHRATLQSW